jgi:DNA-binding NtrC family response regulator
MANLPSALAATGIHFLGKPFNPAQLTRMVRKVLDEEASSERPNEMPKN